MAVGEQLSETNMIMKYNFYYLRVAEAPHGEKIGIKYNNYFCEPRAERRA